MKKLFVFLMFLSLCPFLFAQNITVKQNTFQKVALTIATENVSVEDVIVPEGVFSMVSLEGCGPSNNPGAPQLPVLVKFLQIPVCESVVATVINSQYAEYDATALGITHPLYPNQPSVSKSETLPPFAYDQTVYTTNEFYALPLVSVEKIGVKRDVALANMYVSPVQYNPVTKKVRVYTRIDVEFTFVNPDMAQTIQLQKYTSPMFSMDKKLLVNEMANPYKAEFSTSPIKYLIVANSMFSGNADLEAFAAWKRRLGYKVEVAYTSDANVGTTTTSIQSFIQNKYNNATAADPAPTFLLLIGDVDQIPSFAGTAMNTHSTDLYYATFAGSDNIPDCYYGRLSATSADELKNQLDKIMMYEQYTMPDPSYLGTAVLIAGTDESMSPTHADGQINYVYDNYINTSSTTHNYTTVYKHSYDCTNEAATIRNEVNNGAGWVNYTAHGSASGWYSPSFSSSHISSMTNAGKYGLWIGNCCQTGTFDASSPCFAEVVLRAQNKGAMGYLGASQVTYWNEDVYWSVGVRSSISANMSYDASNLGMYDKLFHTHNEAQSTWVSTIGGILYGGNQAVQASSSSMKLYYWEIYHCFGDPSVRMFLGMPNTMNVTADDIVLGEDQYTVQAVPYAYVALKKNVTEFVAATFANASGIATLTLPSDLESGTYELVVLAQNYIPYFQEVEVVEEGNCVSPSGLDVSDVTPFTATLSWEGETDGVYNIQLKAGDANWASEVTGITASTYTLTGLQDNTEYKARIQTVCGNETSSWRTVTFTTPVACPVPAEPVCTAFTPTTATLSWTENGSASRWILQYSKNSSFSSGVTQLTVNGSPTKTLTNLIAETTYYARVKAVCGGAYGNSQWSAVGTFLPSAVQTVEIGDGGSANNNYLPSYNYYNYTFSQQIYTPDEIGSAGTIKSIAFKNDGAEKARTLSIYLQQTNKETFDSTADWVAVSANNLVFSGNVTLAAGEWTKINFTNNFVFDGTSNLLVSVADNTGSWSSSPHMSCLVYDATDQAIYAYRDSDGSYDISAPGVNGTVLDVKNQIQVDIVPTGGPICTRPKSLAASDVTANAATLSWTENGVASEWMLQYGTDNTFAAGTYNEVTVTGTPTQSLTGLTAETQYYARVKSVCGDGDESAWSVVCAFMPSVMTVVGAGTETNNLLPTNNYYNYSLTQQIYTPAELGMAGDIQSIAFYKNNTVECNRTLDIYMVNTTKNSFTGSTDWITVSAADKVFSGTVSFANNEWTTITLNTPFSYDGTQNVAIIVDDNTGSYKSNTSFLVFSAPSQAIRIYSDGTNYDATAPSSYSGTVESTKNQVRFFIERAPECPAPTDVMITNVNRNSAVVSWTEAGDATSWVIAYRNDLAMNDPFTEVEVSEPTYTLTDLTEGTLYVVKVRPVCDGITDSWSDTEFSTESCYTIPLSANEPSWTENFDNYTQSTTAATGVEPDCWELVQEDVEMPDAKRPQLYYKSTFAHSGNYSLRMYNRCVYAMPKLSEDVDIQNVKLAMYLRQANAVYQLEVGVWDDELGTFEPVALFNNETTDVELVRCEFNEYTGNGRRIAFRNVLGKGNYAYSYNYIDDITLSLRAISGECDGTISTLPHTEDFEDYTSVTMAVTGIAPDCWELVQEDVDMPEDKMPQLYYKSSFAHSGDYSLRMYNRCVYAMPSLDAVDANISDLSLSMYLRQPNTAYTLEVGVWESGSNSEEAGVFVPVHVFNNKTTDVTFVECDFSSYTGNGGRIAFRNTLSGGRTWSYSYNYLDDITIDNAVSAKGSASDENVIDAIGVERYLEGIAVYPNPTTGELHIGAVDVQKVECYNQMGQLVAVYDNDRDINISSLSQGVYTLRITVPQGVTMRKVVKR